MDWSRICGINVMFYQLFRLSFWRHPFNAEDPSMRLLQNYYKSVLIKKQTHLHLGWPEIAIPIIFYNDCFKTKCLYIWGKIKYFDRYILDSPIIAQSFSAVKNISLQSTCHIALVGTKNDLQMTFFLVVWMSYFPALFDRSGISITYSVAARSHGKWNKDVYETITQNDWFKAALMF